MAHRTLAKAQDQIFRHYAQREYQTALDLLNREARLFDPYPDDLFYFRACLSARAGDPGAALNALAEAEAAGCFYGERALRDSDLDTLRDDPEFERLREVFIMRWVKAKEFGEPRLLVRTPAGAGGPGAGGPFPLLVTLHGHGGRPETDSVHWEPALEQGWILAAPQSSQIMASSRYGWPDLELGRREVAAHVRSLTEQYPADPRRVVLGGFSRGAAVVLQMVLSGEIPATGFVALAPALQVEEVHRLIADCPPDRIRGTIIVGAKDALSYERALEVAALMQRRGIACALEVHPDLGHAAPPDFAASLARALDFVTR